MSNVVNFVCHGCEAMLSVPIEMAGISGPCPFCGAHVNSPQAVMECTIPGDPGISDYGESKARPQSPAEEPGLSRFWLQPHLVTPAPPRARPGRRRPGMVIAASLVVFAGGVAGAWKLWEPPKPESATEKEPENVPARMQPVIPRPEVLASAHDIPSARDLPAPSDGIPDVLPPASTAVARNLSTTASATAPVPAATSTEPGVKSVPPETQNTTTQPAAKMSAAEKKIRKVIHAEGQLEKPGNALIRFFAATTWQERLRYSLCPEKVRPLMEQHYKTYAEGPIIPEDIELTRIEATEEDPNRKYYAFVVFLPDVEHGIPVSVEDTKNGCLVEWCSFIEAKDQMLSKFFKGGFRKEPGTFRVLVRRSHYFGDDVPAQEVKECLEVVGPDTAGPYHLWLDKSSVPYTKFFVKGERTRWDISSMMVLTCQWEKTSKGVEYVRLRDVVADSWHPAMLPAQGVAAK